MQLSGREFGHFSIVSGGAAGHLHFLSSAFLFFFSYCAELHICAVLRNILKEGNCESLISLF